jgi:hypothetical protein
MVVVGANVKTAKSTAAAIRQPHLFEDDEQSDLFGGQPTPEYRPDPDSVRAGLHKILGEARAPQKLPWDPARVSLYRTIFPQMTNWLPEDEGAQLRFEFEAELVRLKWPSRHTGSR